MSINNLYSIVRVATCITCETLLNVVKNGRKKFCRKKKKNVTEKNLKKTKLGKKIWGIKHWVKKKIG